MSVDDGMVRNGRLRDIAQAISIERSNRVIVKRLDDDQTLMITRDIYSNDHATGYEAIK
jgi:hypothetical protein